MPSTTSSSLFRLLPSSTVMTPSLPTLSIASAMILPISSSLLAAMEATFSRSFFDLTGIDAFFDGLFDAALHEHGVDARDDGAQAFDIDRFGEDGGGGGAVAGDVVGL